MGARTYRDSVIVVRKTRLRETDLILTLLAQDGRQLRAVAKGAQKPTSSFASRLELFAEAQVLLVEGRTLDIVKEAKLTNAHGELRFDYERALFAAPIAELLAHATQPELPVEKLYPMTSAALDTASSCSIDAVPLILSAYLLKASALLGFRPALSECAECGSALSPGSPMRPFSARDGGVLCAECAQLRASRPLPDALIGWMRALIGSTFAQIASFDADPKTQAALLRCARAWVSQHVADLKSLPLALASMSER